MLPVVVWVLLAGAGGCALVGGWRLVWWARTGRTCCYGRSPGRVAYGWLTVGIGLAMAAAAVIGLGPLW